MKISEESLRELIKETINEFSTRPTRTMPSADDRRFAVSALPKSSIQGGDVSQTDAVKLMSASTGFFQTLVDAIRFGFLTREEVNRICSSLESGCEDNFRTLVVSHPCLKWWKNDVSKIAMKIGDDTEFKRDFCESIKSNCEMVRSNYNRALGNIKQININ
tara:strand:- start:14 stop:496 length:483 start_codon:yes stop_codon:yes gene_type:complete